MNEYVPGQNNPGQEPLKLELSFPEAVRLIAERVAFRTEEEQRGCLAAIDAEVERHAASEPADTEGDDEDGQPTGPGPTDPTPAPAPRVAKKTAARTRR